MIPLPRWSYGGSKIKLMKTRATVVALYIVVVGCATTEKYEKVLEAWIGAHSDELVAAWGPPQSVYTFSGGRKVLQYVGQRTVTYGGYTYTEPVTTYHSGSLYGTRGRIGSYSGTSTSYVTGQTPILTDTLSCTTRFTTNKAGYILGWSHVGNDCVASKVTHFDEREFSRQYLSKRAHCADGYALEEIGHRYKYGLRGSADPVLAYVWYSAAATRGNSGGAMSKELIAMKMAAEQIAEAEKLVKEWKVGSCE